jgi:hypothetical protein
MTAMNSVTYVAQRVRVVHVQQWRDQDAVQPAQLSGINLTPSLQLAIQRLVDPLQQHEHRHHRAHGHERPAHRGVEGRRAEARRVVHHPVRARPVAPR